MIREMESTSYNMDYPVERKEKKTGSSTCSKVTLALVFFIMFGCIIGLAIVLVRNEIHTAHDELAGHTKPVITDDADQMTTVMPEESDEEEEKIVSASGNYRFAAVASENDQCSKIGTEVLAVDGGSAVDAAIATMLCLGVIHSAGLGIGGGLLMTIYDSPTNEVLALNSREVAPLAATETMFVNKSGASVTGGLAIAVPGEIAGYKAAHDRFGRVTWSRLFQPTIKLCEDGFVVPMSLEKAINEKIDVIREMEGLRKVLMKEDGTPYMEGDVMTRPELGKTLCAISEQGAQAFYNGSLTDDIVADIQDHGGIITREDFEAYKPLWKEPIQAIATHVADGDYTFYGPPPPSSAAVLYYILNIMSGFDVTPADRDDLDKRSLLDHRLVEAMKFGNGKRTKLGDEDFANVTELKSLLQSIAYAEEARGKIQDDRVLLFDEYESAFGTIPADGGTSHLNVYDRDGSAVSMTSTINTYFGSLIRGNRTGIIFNNEMDDFSTPGLVNFWGYSPFPENFITPGKRPMSSMSPTIVMDKDGKVALLVGASGGSRIISATINSIVNNLWLNYTVSEAVDQSRFHHQLLPDNIWYEASWSNDIREKLAEKGHALEERDFSENIVQMIRNYCSSTSDEYCIHAVSDFRQGGIPDGY